MQRTQKDGVIISCDFCGTDWDQVRPMIEGHHGSVLCLECLKQALTHHAPAAQKFQCTLCLQDRPAGVKSWAPQPRPAAANPQARACLDCLHQAARAFDRDPDVAWKWQK